MYNNGPYGGPQYPWWMMMPPPQQTPPWVNPTASEDINPRQVRRALKIQKLIDEFVKGEEKKKEKKEDHSLLKGNFTKLETYMMLIAASPVVFAIEALLLYKLYMALPFIPH